MSEVLHFKIPPDFAERCRATNLRVEAGEAFTMQNLSDALGLPFEFVAAAQAIAIALASGQCVIVDPRPIPKSN